MIKNNPTMTRLLLKCPSLTAGLTIFFKTFVSLVFPTVQRTKKKRHLSVFSIWCSPCCPCDISSDTSATSNTSTTSLSTSTIPRCDSLIFFLSNPSHGRKSQVLIALECFTTNSS
ncbi:unnamed protein product, partial [Vitis vinifera]|uniref:Uncharacterized protein n=1 Tax=Vitis vinifera TaxID=29760 RepID=D7U7A0_VITVI